MTDAHVAPRWWERKLPTTLSLWNVAGLLLILLISADLRIEAVTRTQVNNAFRADAAEYFFSAYNLKEFGVYSETPTLPKPPARALRPSAIRSPGYPLFLYPFISRLPTYAMLRSILLTQALLGVATVLLTYLLCLTFLSPSMALLPAFLTGISPHLVNMTVYPLSETLFCFLMVLAFWVLVPAPAGRPVWQNSLAAFVGGALLSAASLTRPGLQYFVVLFALFSVMHSRSSEHPMGKWRTAGWLLFGFCLVYAPWVIRNFISLGYITNDRLMIDTLENGMYPNFMYHGDPRTYGFPYAFDPHVAAISKSVGTALRAIWAHFEHTPGRYLKWYLVGKPITLWQWSIIAGVGDVFVYPVLQTPYTYLPQFELTHWLMFHLHWALVILGLAGSLAVWAPARISGLSMPARFVARMVSLNLWYWTALLMVGAPYPRYSIPLRPFLFSMAVLGPVMMFSWMRAKKRAIALTQEQTADSG